MERLDLRDGRPKTIKEACAQVARDKNLNRQQRAEMVRIAKSLQKRDLRKAKRRNQLGTV